jgi:rhomboid protease GluP
MDGSNGATTARQIAAYCLAREGFAVGVPPEAAELAQACDIVLTRLHWSQLHILCLVDGESRPGRQFAMMPTRAEALAKACLKYSGSINFSKMPVLVEIVEVAAGAPSESDRARLRRFRRSSIFSKGVLIAEHVDATTRQVWRNRWHIARTTPERALRAAPVSGDELQALASRSTAMPVRPAWPVVTFAIIALLAVVYALEVAAAGGSEPGTLTLMSMGGINRKLMLAGEWWRVVAAPMLHANVGHLLANGVALLMAGSVLELMIGRLWFAATYIVSALTGALLTVLLGTSYTVSVGASGAVMGVVAAATVIGLVRRRREFGIEAFRLLISVLIPTLGTAVWGGAAAAHIDHFGHFGGAIGGAVMALALLGLWRKDDRVPGQRLIAQAIIAAGCLALAAGSVEVALHRAVDASALVPESVLPRNPTQRSARMADLVARYPGDPRTHFALAQRQFQERKVADAEESLRKALSLDRALTIYFDPSFGVQVRAALAWLLMSDHKEAEAKDVAKPLCDLSANAPGVDARVKAMRQSLCR